MALLEAEMRALRASVDEAALKFDEALQVDKGRELGGERGGGERGRKAERMKGSWRGGEGWLHPGGA